MFLRWCAAFGLLALASANAHATDAELETARRVAGPSVVRLTDVKGNLEMGATAPASSSPMASS